MNSLLLYLGIEPGRFKMSWVSASEGGKFGEVVTGIVEDIRALGPIKRFNRGIDLAKLGITRAVISPTTGQQQKNKVGETI